MRGGSGASGVTPQTGEAVGLTGLAGVGSFWVRLASFFNPDPLLSVTYWLRSVKKCFLFCLFSPFLRRVPYGAGLRPKPSRHDRLQALHLAIYIISIAQLFISVKRKIGRPDG